MLDFILEMMTIASLLGVLKFESETPPSLILFMLVSQQVTLFGEVLELLGGRTWHVKIGY